METRPLPALPDTPSTGLLISSDLASMRTARSAGMPTWPAQTREGWTDEISQEIDAGRFPHLVAPRGT
jgi:hypothetical protein